MKNLNKYESPEIEVVVIENDIIITSGGDIGPGEPNPGENPYEGRMRSSEILHIFKNN